jgi:DNA replication protein DnaC
MFDEYSKDENFFCIKCDGTGWIIDGDKPAVRCQCFFDKQKVWLLERAKIPRRYSDCTFSGFLEQDLKIKKDSREKNHNRTLSIYQIKTAKEDSESFVKKYPAVNKGLLFMGNPGVGKTHLAVSIIKALIQEKSIPCIFVDFRELLQNIKYSYDRSSQVSQYDILKPVLETDVVVLDDLGAEKITGWVLDNLGYIINWRYNEKKISIITTNFLDEEAIDPKRNVHERERTHETLSDRIGLRLRSRLYEMCTTIYLFGDDFRKKGKDNPI